MTAWSTCDKLNQKSERLGGHYCDEMTVCFCTQNSAWCNVISSNNECRNVFEIVKAKPCLHNEVHLHEGESDIASGGFKENPI